ncbi:MAG TPA: hypothetical protein VMU59_04810 [Caulobacteraceae bacterium]|nr:hypothetical protein [Caulobacteraceae bacterium]
MNVLKSIHQLLVRSAVVAAVALYGTSPAEAQNTAMAADSPKTNYPGGPGSLDGIWNAAAYTSVRMGRPDDQPRFVTDEGEPLPLLPWAAKVVKDRTPPGFNYLDDSLHRCIHRGMPYGVSTTVLSPLQIIEAPQQKQITVLFETFTAFRIINMDQNHPPHPTPSYMGNEVGHWEGDTLVVDTIAVSDKTTIMSVVPHSVNMHLVERIRRTGPDTMEDRMTIDDPATFSKPWSVTERFKKVPGMRMAEFICENPE